MLPDVSQAFNWHNPATAGFANLANTSIMGDGKSSSNGFKDFLSNGGGAAVMGGLGSLVGGIFGQDANNQMASSMENAQGMQRDLYDQGLKYYQPYYDGGQQAYGKYSGAIDQMADPTKFLNGITSQYSMSPEAQFQMGELNRISNNAAANSGTVGTPAQQMGLMRYGQGIIGQDQQRFINNNLGINNQYLSGLSGLNNMGFDAAHSMAGNRQGLADNLAMLMMGAGRANAAGTQSMGAGIGGMLGSIGGSMMGGPMGGMAGNAIGSALEGLF